MYSSRTQTSDTVGCLISHVRQLSEKSGIPPQSTPRKISKTKKVFEHHQMQQLNSDPMFVEIAQYIIENITEECVIPESIRGNYNLLSKMGILEMDSQSLDFNIATQSINLNDANREYTIEQLKDMITSKKQELVDSKSKYELVKKQNDLLDKHNSELTQRMQLVDNASDSITNKLNNEPQTSLNNADDENEGFSEFKANLESYRNEVIDKFGIILEPIKGALKGIISAPQLDISLLQMFHECNSDGLLNSTLNTNSNNNTHSNNNTNSNYNSSNNNNNHNINNHNINIKQENSVQQFGGIFKTHLHMNQQINQLLSVLLKRFVPLLLKKYNNTKCDDNCENDEFLSTTKTMSNNKLRMRDRDYLLKLLLSTLDINTPHINSNKLSYNFDENKLCSYLKDYSKICAELKYNSLVNQAEEIGYLELVNLINSQHITFWKNQLTKFGRKSSLAVEQIRDELHGFLISTIKPYMNEKMKIWEIKKVDTIASLIEQDLQPLGPITNYMKNTYSNFNKQIDSYINLLIQKESMLKGCENQLEKMLFLLNNRVLKSVSLEDINIIPSQYNININTNINVDCNLIHNINKWSILALSVDYLASLYNIRNNNATISVVEHPQSMTKLVKLIKEDAELCLQLTNEDNTSLIEEVKKFVDNIKLAEIKLESADILDSVLPPDIVATFDKFTSVIEESEKKLNDQLNEISTKNKMLVSDKKLQSNRSDLLRFCLEC